MKRCHSNIKPDLLRAEKTAISKSKISKPRTPEIYWQKSKDRQSSERTSQSNQHLLKTGNKQQNISSENPSFVNDCPSDEPTMVEVTVKTSNAPKQRSRSTVSDRQPWGQLLRGHGGENESAFGSFDPLRTLHFLGRELQAYMQARMPDETNLHDIIKAMHSALKRIPPEVASTVQLQQQTVDLLPKLTKIADNDCFDTENLNDNQPVRSSKKSEHKEFSDIQKLIEGSTMKMEATCKHLDNICSQLRDEKLSLERTLQMERTNTRILQAKLQEVENANRQLSENLNGKDEEIVQLKSTIETLESKLQERRSITNEAQFTSTELKRSKQEVLKLEHQLRVCAMEKEKYLAILAVRDRQIYEIRNEMTQLQQTVNEQLVEIHNYALASVPPDVKDKDENEPNTISSIWTNQEPFQNKSENSISDDEDHALQPTRDNFRN